MKRITKLIYLALGSCLIAGLNVSCELVSENYGDINTSIFPQTAEDADAITTSAAYATFKNSGYGGLFNIATYKSLATKQAITECATGVGTTSTMPTGTPSRYPVPVAG